jgi:dienelactone hydrolase
MTSDIGPRRATSLEIPAAGRTLQADLTVPASSTGLVIFAHGSGSGRHSPRNQFVARALQEHGLATLLADLLTMDEEGVDRVTAQLRFDIDLLGRRVIGLVDWARQNPATSQLPVGLFGASTGAAAALVAAAARPSAVSAVVSRGGRPDLAGASLPLVLAPTLMIVGGADTAVIELNQTAARHMRSVTRMEVVAGATHLFEEPGTLEHVAELAATWFTAHLGTPLTSRA